MDVIGSREKIISFLTVYGHDSPTNEKVSVGMAF